MKHQKKKKTTPTRRVESHSRNKPRQSVSNERSPIESLLPKRSSQNSKTCAPFRKRKKSFERGTNHSSSKRTRRRKTKGWRGNDEKCRVQKSRRHEFRFRNRWQMMMTTTTAGTGLPLYPSSPSTDILVSLARAHRSRPLPPHKRGYHDDKDTPFRQRRHARLKEARVRSRHPPRFISIPFFPPRFPPRDRPPLEEIARHGITRTCDFISLLVLVLVLVSRRRKGVDSFWGWFSLVLYIYCGKYIYKICWQENRVERFFRGYEGRFFCFYCETIEIRWGEREKRGYIFHLLLDIKGFLFFKRNFWDSRGGKILRYFITL